jgi:hypothetical protein
LLSGPLLLCAGCGDDEATGWLLLGLLVAGEQNLAEEEEDSGTPPPRPPVPTDDEGDWDPPRPPSYVSEWEVRSNLNQNPLEGVWIRWYQWTGEWGSYTNERIYEEWPTVARQTGAYGIARFQVGFFDEESDLLPLTHYRVVVSASGFETQEYHLQTGDDEGEDVHYNIYLVPYSSE